MGISRDMHAGMDQYGAAIGPPAPPDTTPYDQGGGDMNGTAAVSLLRGQAGTPGIANGVPRALGASLCPDYTGVV